MIPITHFFLKHSMNNPFFPGYDSDPDEKYETDITKCYKTTAATETTQAKTEPINGAGRRSKRMLEKNRQKFRIKLFSPLSSMTSLIPNAVDVGIKLYITSSMKTFQDYLFRAKPHFLH